jgi:hypothetical protein
MRRRVDALVLGLLVVGLFALLIWPSPSRVTQGNFERIKEGMGRADVEAILGHPGDSTTGLTFPIYRELIDDWPPVGTTLIDWTSDSVWITVAFDSSGRVVRCVCSENVRISQGPLENLLWRLKRPWHRWFPE